MINANDVSKELNKGVGSSPKNGKGDYRGMGKRKATFKAAEKRPKNWNKDHRQSFIEGRPAENMAMVIHADTTHISNKVWMKKRSRGLVGKTPIHRRTQEKVIGTASAFIAVWPGDSENEPGIYAELEPNLPKCEALKKRKPCPHGDNSGPGRVHGSSGTAATHAYHLKRFVKKHLHQRGFKPVKRTRKTPRAKLCVQLDKSTCQSYNRGENEFGYLGVPTKKTKAILAEIEHEYQVSIKVVIQPTHSFDFNAPDALIHSAIKREMRDKKPPQTFAHLKRDFYNAVRSVCHGRTTQRSFVRAYSRNSDGDVDLSLVPEEIMSWYDDGVASENEDDFEIEWDSDTGFQI